MLGQPGLDVGVVVGAVVVEDQVHLEVLGDLAVDELQEGQELLVAVAGQAQAHDLAGGGIEGGEEGGGPVALVVVRHGHRPALLHGKLGWVRSSAWIWLFSSTQSTTARSGGSR